MATKERPTLSKKQKESIRAATARLNLWEGSVRSSKTVASIWRFLQFVGNAPKSGELLLAGKTMDALKRNVINPIIELVGNEAHYSSGLREMRLFGRTIHTVGASDERSEGKIRGATLCGSYGDEITLWPESFFRMMLSRMSVEGAKFFGTTNPDNPNHWLKKDFIDRADDLEMKVFHFLLEDNPYLPKSYVDSLKKEYTGLWYKRFILGEWCIAEGAIFDFFDEAKHVIDRVPEAMYYDVGIDYGTTNPCVFILYGNNPTATPKIWAEREYYFDPKTEKKQKTDAQFSKDFINFISPVRNKVRGIYCDPSAESFQVQLKADGITGLRDAENDVLNGIRTVGRMLHSGEFALTRGVPNYIKEMYGYCWDSKAQIRGEDKPLKTNDHCQDNGRYVLHSKFGTGGYSLDKFAD